ncbi:MAG: rhomboid family intramembrane serine protease [Muribaculaceae bacterium]
MMQYSGRSFLGSIPPVTKNLLIISFLMWFAQTALPRIGIDVDGYLGLHYWGASQFNVIQLVSYMFLHADFSHIFFNMFSLWMFGRILEQVMGGKRYLFYYISCGFGAAIVQELVWTLTWRSEFIPALANLNSVSIDQMTMYVDEALASGRELPFLNQMLTIGASGGVFGILLAFGMLFPNMPLYLMFIPVPIKAKWMVIGYGLIELAFGVSGIMSSVAHFAHLGGMLFGFFILLYWRKKGFWGGGYY